MAVSFRARRRTAARALLAAAPVLGVIAATGCTSFVQTKVIRQSRDIRVTTSAQPAAGIRVVKRVQTASAGRSVELFHAQRVDGHRLQVDLVMRAGRPTVSHTALSSYAYAPAHGNYVTFPMTIRNRGQVTVLVKPTDFFVDVGNGETHVTSYDGNAAYSGAHEQLDPTALQPGQAVSKPLTFDVGSTHGVLTYAPERRPAIRWRF